MSDRRPPAEDEKKKDTVSMTTLDLMSYRHCRMQWKLSTEHGFPLSLPAEALTCWTDALGRACVALGEDRESAIRGFGNRMGELAPFFVMPEVMMYSSTGSKTLRQLVGGKDPELLRRGYRYNPDMIQQMDVLVGDDLVNHRFMTLGHRDDQDSCYVLHPSSPFMKNGSDAPPYDGPFYWLNIMLVNQMNIMTKQQTGIGWKLLMIDVGSFREGGACTLNRRIPNNEQVDLADRYLQDVVGGLKRGIYYPGTKSRGLCFGCPGRGPCWEEGLNYT